VQTDRYEQIRRQQAVLVRALCTADGAFPVGFEYDRIKVTKDALVSKRARVCTHYCPLFSNLGDRFDDLFHQYAIANPLVDPSPTLDARRFIRFLLKRSEHIDGQLLRWFVGEEAAHAHGAMCVRYCESRMYRALGLRIGTVSLSWLRAL
jgi:hypothetical protein